LSKACKVALSLSVLWIPKSFIWVVLTNDVAIFDVQVVFDLTFQVQRMIDWVGDRQDPFIDLVVAF
jgi:hypothetical protein